MIVPMIAALAFALQDGDRVLFYGDSITEQRLYTTYVETFVRTRFPQLKVQFVAAGIGGDTTWGGWLGTSEERAKRDVAPHNPTKITIMLGMNDAGYVPFDPKIESVFIEWYGKLLGYLRKAAPKAAFTLIQTSPFDDFSGRPSQFAGYNDTLLKFGRNVKAIAEREKYTFVDFNAPVADAMKNARATGVDVSSFLPDSIHPGPPGHLIMAGELLKAWGETAEVSTVELDAATKKVEVASRAKVSKFDGTSWTQLDQSLPFAVDEGAALGAQFTNFYDALDRQMLTVRNLPLGHYELTIDGSKVPGTISDADWAKGVNLAKLDTPMRKQAQRVHDLATQRNEVVITGWERMGLILGNYKHTAEVQTALRHLAEEIDAHEWAACQPLPHHFQLKRVDE